MFRRLFLLTALASTAGCTHLQLERSTLKQNSTWTDLQYRQVLDNLAMFCKNSSAMPYFSVAGTGTTQVSDSGNLAASFSIQESIPLLSVLSGAASRQIAEQWTVAPTTDPGKLEVIRCLYQFTVCSSLSQECINTINGFFNYPDGLCTVQWERFPHLQTGWFHVGCKKDVPGNACYVGHYCDVYVWVPPEGCEGLTQLALAVLDVATADPAPSVVEHYDVRQDQGDCKYKVDRYVCRDPKPPCQPPHNAKQPLQEARATFLKLDQHIKDLSMVNTDEGQQKIRAVITSALGDAITHLKDANSYLSKADQTKLDGIFRRWEKIQVQGAPPEEVANFAAQAAKDVETLGAPSPMPPGRLNFFQPFQSQGLQFVPRR